MSTDYHVPIPSSPRQPANADTINIPLSQLDQAIKDLAVTQQDGHIIQRGGSDIAQQQRLNFAGYGVAAENDAANSASKVLGAPNVPNARLTLTSGTPVTTNDVTAATTLYLSPLYGGKFTLSLDNGSGLEVIRLSAEISISLAGLTANKNYDVFGYDNSGTLALELLAWSTDAARATALANNNLGFLVKSGTVTRRYLGTIRITGTTGQCEDSKTKRYVWNLYNRRSRPMEKLIASNWSYTTASWRQANADTSNKVEFVVGQVEEPISAQYTSVLNGTVSSYIGVGINSTSSVTNPSRRNSANASAAIDICATLPTALPTLGYNYIAGIEYGAASATFAGNSIFGVSGWVYS